MVNTGMYVTKVNKFCNQKIAIVLNKESFVSKVFSKGNCDNFPNNNRQVTDTIFRIVTHSETSGNH